MSKLVLLGDEAIGQGALDAGLSGVYAYPGTPSTEITEYIQHSEEAGKRRSIPNGRPTKKQPWKLRLGCPMPEREPWFV